MQQKDTISPLLVGGHALPFGRAAPTAYSKRASSVSQASVAVRHTMSLNSLSFRPTEGRVGEHVFIGEERVANWISSAPKPNILFSLHVEEPYRKRGIAGLLMRRFEDACSERGYDCAVVLATWESHTYYERHGYQRIQWPYDAWWSVGRDAFIMGRLLKEGAQFPQPGFLEEAYALMRRCGPDIWDTLARTLFAGTPPNGEDGLDGVGDETTVPQLLHDLIRQRRPMPKREETMGRWLFRLQTGVSPQYPDMGPWMSS